jgi:biopolymer transport protein ExbD
MAAARLANIDAPLSELNTTPLIDVLLVLLILFVITIPAATDSLDIELPQGRGPVIDRIANRVMVTADNRVLWNDAAISQPQLAGLIATTRNLPVEPALLFEAESAARYDLAAQTVRTIKLSGAGSIGMVGNERFAEFGKAR